MHLQNKIMEITIEIHCKISYLSFLKIRNYRVYVFVAERKSIDEHESYHIFSTYENDDILTIRTFVKHSNLTLVLFTNYPMSMIMYYDLPAISLINSI